MKLEIKDTNYKVLKPSETKEIKGGGIELAVLLVCYCLGCMSAANGGPRKKCTRKVNTSKGIN